MEAEPTTTYWGAQSALDTGMGPARSQREPQLPSQRAAANQGTRTTGVLAPKKAVADAFCAPGVANPQDQAAGYTYMPINMDYPGLKCIHQQPPIFVVDNFLTNDECDALVATAGPLLQRSKTHAAAGSEATKGRTSLTCHLAKKVFPCPLMLQKIQTLTNKPYGHMELPQVARYASSQRYVEHYDGVDPHTDAGRAFCASGGQRVATVLMYINDVAEGGATRFKRLDLEVKPKKGNALIFFPGFMNGELDTDALHAGMPAVDTKWVSQVWIRQSFREDGQPSAPVPIEEQSLIGPLHEGIYKGLSTAGYDVHEEVMTFEEARALASKLPQCQGFTYESKDRYPTTPVRVWFKSKLNILYNEDWWSWSTGAGM